MSILLFPFLILFWCWQEQKGLDTFDLVENQFQDQLWSDISNNVSSLSKKRSVKFLVNIDYNIYNSALESSQKWTAKYRKHLSKNGEILDWNNEIVSSQLWVLHNFVTKSKDFHLFSLTGDKYEVNGLDVYDLQIDVEESRQLFEYVYDMIVNLKKNMETEKELKHFVDIDTSRLESVFRKFLDDLYFDGYFVVQNNENVGLVINKLWSYGKFDWFFDSSIDAEWFTISYKDNNILLYEVVKKWSWLILSVYDSSWKLSLMLQWELHWSDSYKIINITVDIYKPYWEQYIQKLAI